MFGFFNKIDAIEQLSIDLEILENRMERTRTDLKLKFEELDEYDNFTRAKFKALASYFGIEFRSHYHPNKHEIKVAEVIDDEEEITTNNQ